MNLHPLGWLWLGRCDQGKEGGRRHKLQRERDREERREHGTHLRFLSGSATLLTCTARTQTTHKSHAWGPLTRPCLLPGDCTDPRAFGLASPLAAPDADFSQAGMARAGRVTLPTTSSCCEYKTGVGAVAREKENNSTNMDMKPPSVWGAVISGA